MTRAEFLRLIGLGVSTALGAPHSRAARSEGGSSRGKSIIPMLYGSPRPETNLDAWFSSLRRWGVRRWMPMLNDYRSSAAAWVERRGTVVPFLADGVPEFRAALDAEEERRKEAHLTDQARYCEKYGLEFWCGLPFPIFPDQDERAIRRALPELFVNGRFMLGHPRVAKILEAEIRSLKKAWPTLQGVNVWLAEGAGGIALSRDDVNHAVEWQTPLIRAIDAVTRELGIGGILFAHNYDLTVAGRRAVYEMAAAFPAVSIMEDITWPEEDMLHPFLGFLPPADREFLFRSNPVALNFLLDTEYLGQGVLPSVYPRWWKRNVREAAIAGVKVGMGRTFFWDGGMTDQNFNRLNAQIFTALCLDPSADERGLLNQAATEMFGSAIPAELLELLWATEPVIQAIIGLNGVDPLSHSRFPAGETLDAAYTPASQGMKSVSDLFEAPGTRLYPQLTGSLSNRRQWRWQNQTVSEEAAVYLRRKRDASKWTAQARVAVERLSDGLAPAHRELFVRGYRALDTLAQGMALYVETAALHHEWAHERSLDDAEARRRFRGFAGQFRELAAQAPDDALGYRTGMTRFASFLETKLPRTSPGDGP